MQDLWNRVKPAWEQIIHTAQSDGGQNVVVVGHSVVASAMLCMCLGLDKSSIPTFRSECGGITIIEFARDIKPENGTIRCINYTAHLGRWAVPISRDDLEGVCGIDGCF